MARTPDHSRQELDLILEQADRQMEEVGFARLSAREVTKRTGYALGSRHSVYGTPDHLLAAANTRTFGWWTDALARLRISIARAAYAIQEGDA